MSNEESLEPTKTITTEELLKLKTEELISKMVELKRSNDSLLASNEALKSKTEELKKSDNALLLSNQGFASVNKQLSETNRRFAETNKKFAEVNEEILTLNKKLVLANEKIKANGKMQTDFINIAAHELRTPTQSILGYSELLHELLLSSEEGQKDSQKIELAATLFKNANRLQKLTENILDVSKIENDALILNKRRFNLNENIEKMVFEIIDQVRITKNDSLYNDNNNNDSDIKIIFESHKREGRKGLRDTFVEADDLRIYQVISNLLSNALKFTNKGTISVTTQDDIAKGEFVVAVKDTGCGISYDMMPKLFSKFATGSSSEGVGLGLFISKSIVESHGGKIWAENNIDNNNNNNSDAASLKGATFAFSLPLVK